MRTIVPVPDKDPRRQLGDLIRRSRVRQELVYRDLAERCGARQDQVKAWEDGTAVPTGNQWARLKGSMSELRAAAPVWKAAVAMEDADVNAVSKREAEDAYTTRVLEARGEVKPDSLVDEDIPPLPNPKEQRSFGAALRVARINHGLRQEDLGELLEVSATSISVWERDESVPVRDNWHKIMDLLPELVGCTPPQVRDIMKPEGNQTNGNLGSTANRSFPRARTVDPVLAPADPPAQVAKGTVVIPVAATAGTPSITLQAPVVAGADPIAQAGIAYAYAMRDRAAAESALEDALGRVTEARKRLVVAEEAEKDAQEKLDAAVFKTEGGS